jgi:dTDP-4-amino-4,6-dideoxygalactose transaminase
MWLKMQHKPIDSYYKSKPLGSIGNLGCFSFHETKNIHCGEGGLLTINDEKLIERAEIIWEKGTNRANFSEVK